MECSLIGFGNFSRQASVYLKDYFKIYAYDKKTDIVFPDFVCSTDLATALSKDIIILSLPVQYMEKFLDDNASLIKDGAMVFDICSVKMKPVDYMNKYFSDKNVYFLGTHPLFGPQTMKKGLEGHKIVLTANDKDSHFYKRVYSFIVDKLGLLIIEMTPEEHDKKMATVQALNHFIVRALMKMDISESIVDTPAYKRLYELYETLKYDSDDLFYTIQRENPYADEIRKEFIKILNMIEGDILNEK